MLFTSRFWNDNIIPREAPCEQNLHFTLSILLRQFLYDGFLCEIVHLRAHFRANPAQRTIGNWHNFIVGQKANQVTLSAAWIQANLVDEGHVASVRQNVGRQLGVEI